MRLVSQRDAFIRMNKKKNKFYVVLQCSIFYRYEDVLTIVPRFPEQFRKSLKVLS